MTNAPVRGGALLLALVLISLNLRPALTSVAPLMERIVADLSLSRATAGLVFAAQSGVFYTLATWLVAHYEQTGFAALQASGYASLFMSFGIVGAFLLPLLAGRVRNRRWLIAAVTSCSTLAILLIGWRPEWLPWLITSVLGVTTAGTFALALALPVLETETPAEASSLTSMMSSAGYLLGGGVPSLIGIGRDLTASYALPFTLLACLSASMVVIALFLPIAPAREAT